MLNVPAVVQAIIDASAVVRTAGGDAAYFETALTPRKNVKCFVRPADGRDIGGHDFIGLKPTGFTHITQEMDDPLWQTIVTSTATDAPTLQKMATIAAAGEAHYAHMTRHGVTTTDAYVVCNAPFRIDTIVNSGDNWTIPLVALCAMANTENWVLRVGENFSRLETQHFILDTLNEGPGLQISQLAEKFTKNTGSVFIMETQELLNACDAAEKIGTKKDATIFVSGHGTVNLLRGTQREIGTSNCDSGDQTICIKTSMLRTLIDARKPTTKFSIQRLSLSALVAHHETCDIAGAETRITNIIEPTELVKTPPAWTPDAQKIWASFGTGSNLIEVSDKGDITMLAKNGLIIAQHDREQTLGTTWKNHLGDMSKTPNMYVYDDSIFVAMNHMRIRIPANAKQLQHGVREPVATQPIFTISGTPALEKFFSAAHAMVRFDMKRNWTDGAVVETNHDSIQLGVFGSRGGITTRTTATCTQPGLKISIPTCVLSALAKITEYTLTASKNNGAQTFTIDLPGGERFTVVSSCTMFYLQKNANAFNTYMDETIFGDSTQLSSTKRTERQKFVKTTYAPTVKTDPIWAKIAANITHGENVITAARSMNKNQSVLHMSSGVFTVKWICSQTA